MPDLVLTPSTSRLITDLAVADLNSDNLPDVIICTGGTVQVFMNTYDTNAQTNPTHARTFAAPVTYSVTDPNVSASILNLTSIAVVQTDLPEGTTTPPDIIAGCANGDFGTDTYMGYLVHFYNQHDGHGTLGATPDVFPLATGAALLAVGDLDGGGFTDIVAVDVPSGKINVIKNKSVAGGARTIDPSISTPDEYFAGAYTSAVAVGDVDNDGLRDILALTGSINFSSGGNVATSNLGFFKNAGSGVFMASSSITLKTVNSNTVTGVVGNIAIGDLNGDGTTAEMAVADGLDNKVSLVTVDPALVALNHGAFIATTTTVTAGPEARYVEVGDLDGDGGLDLFVANTDDTTPGSILTNSVAGAGSDILPSRGIAFGKASTNGAEGGTVDIKVLRGQDSHGQVLAFFTEGGSAVQNFGKTPGCRLHHRGSGCRSSDHL